MKMLGTEATLTGEDDNAAPGKLARVGPRLVIAERFGDRAKSRPHHFMAYRVDPGEPSDAGTLGAGRVLFILQAKHFASPPDYHLHCICDPRAWFNTVMVEIHLALEPVSRHAN
jgi:hypothetical protein